MHTVAEMEKLFGRRNPDPAPVARPRIVALPLHRVAPVSLGRCCAAAVEFSCVCIAAWTCPTHGESHYGSHE